MVIYGSLSQYIVMTLAIIRYSFDGLYWLTLIFAIQLLMLELISVLLLLVEFFKL